VDECKPLLEGWLPAELWGEATLLLIGFGQEVCTPRRPHCGGCPLSTMCPSAFAWSECEGGREGEVGEVAGGGKTKTGRGEVAGARETAWSGEVARGRQAGREELAVGGEAGEAGGGDGEGVEWGKGSLLGRGSGPVGDVVDVEDL